MDKKDVDISTYSAIMTSYLTGDISEEKFDELILEAVADAKKAV